MPFKIQPQKGNEWCWAAVAVSVERFFSRAVEFTSQCALAQKVLEKAGMAPSGGCCGANKPACDIPFGLTPALEHVGHFKERRAGILFFSQIADAIDAGFPVCARIGWNGGGGHFVVIHGYLTSDSGTRYLDIADPLYTSDLVTYDDFRTSYKSTEAPSGGGGWTHTYLLKEKE